jgi:iron complex outermembrane receptor protein
MNVLRPLWLAPLVMLAASALAQQPLPASVVQKVTLHIDPQPVGDALSEFGRQTGLTVMIQSAVGHGMISPRLEGEFTPATALEKLLAHTGLHYEYLDAKTVAVLGPRVDSKTTARRINADATELAQRPEPTADGPAAMTRLASNSGAPSAGDQYQDASDEPGGKVEQVVVTGTRILGETPVALPLVILDQDYITRSGVQTTEELLDTLPQNFKGALSSANGVIGAVPVPSEFDNSYGSGVNLRGRGQASTLVLINGARTEPRFMPPECAAAPQ